jgi:hypothetical protein
MSGFWTLAFCKENLSVKDSAHVPLDIGVYPSFLPPPLCVYSPAIASLSEKSYADLNNSHWRHLYTGKHTEMDHCKVGSFLDIYSPQSSLNSLSKEFTAWRNFL